MHKVFDGYEYLFQYQIGVFDLGSPRSLDFNSVQQAFLSIEGVSLVHNLRIWALSMDKTAVAAHLVVRKCNFPDGLSIYCRC